MSIFTRYKEIVEANINAMLAKSDNPERMLRLMIQDMEDTLVEMKASCAESMAEKARTMRTCERVRGEIDRWTERATLALSKGRDDMAREALLRKREVIADVASLEGEIRSFGEAILKNQDDILQVEVKLREAREKHRNLILHPETKVEKPPVPKKDGYTVIPPTPPPQAPKPDDEIEKELSALKSKLNDNNSQR
jgi:phage shock protein A